ncbi:hypothetical protein Daesc_010399 [Daldinia eschscholtzii]|uniref:Dipeptidyl-peptidase V n=1 Tax=Daldinia eschscholtzii TaxID=292717 RepID=A0AAX6M7J5_9PEZI
MDSHPTNKLFTPKTLVEVPSRKNTEPNSDGTKLLYNETESLFLVDGSQVKYWKVMDIATGESTRAPVDEKAYEARWLPEEPNIIIALVPCFDNSGNTHVIVYDIQKPESKWYAGRIYSKVTTLSVKCLKDGRFAFVVYGDVGINGELQNTKNYRKPTCTGLVYDIDEVRYLNQYIKPNQRRSIFYSILTKELKPEGISWKLLGGLHNALANTDLEPMAYTISEGGIAFIAGDRGEADGGWPLTPKDMRFAPNGKTLYVTAEEHARVSLYKIDLQLRTKPEMLFRGGYVDSIHLLGKDGRQLLITSSTFVDGSLYSIVNTDEGHESRVLSSVTGHGARLGITMSQFSEIYFKGSGDHNVHAWMVKPSHFDESRKYPLAILVHGGPVSSWKDQWNLGNHFAMYAEQGYIVVAPNIAGSTGFGMEFQNDQRLTLVAIRDSFGGRPYDDLVKCMDYLEKNPNIDINNAVMIGESYGGYMVNWVQGHALGRRFKAMVCVSGIFDLAVYWLESDGCNTADIRYFFSGSEILWENYEMLQRFNPARPDLLPNWKTPMLIVHGDKDYRTPVTGAIAAFRTLQNLGTPSRLLLYPDEGHGNSKLANILQRHREVLAWINKYTGIAEEEVVPREDELESKIREKGYLGPDWGHVDHLKDVSEANRW